MRFIMLVVVCLCLLVGCAVEETTKKYYQVVDADVCEITVVGDTDMYECDMTTTYIVTVVLNKPVPEGVVVWFEYYWCSDTTVDRVTITSDNSVAWRPSPGGFEYWQMVVLSPTDIGYEFKVFVTGNDVAESDAHFYLVVRSVLNSRLRSGEGEYEFVLHDEDD